MITVVQARPKNGEQPSASKVIQSRSKNGDNYLPVQLFRVTYCQNEEQLSMREVVHQGRLL